MSSSESSMARLACLEYGLTVAQIDNYVVEQGYCPRTSEGRIIMSDYVLNMSALDEDVIRAEELVIDAVVYSGDDDDALGSYLDELSITERELFDKADGFGNEFFVDYDEY